MEHPVEKVRKVLTVNPTKSLRRITKEENLSLLLPCVTLAYLSNTNTNKATKYFIQ